MEFTQTLQKLKRLSGVYIFNKFGTDNSNQPAQETPQKDTQTIAPTVATYTPVYDELVSSRPPFTSVTHRDVYDAIDPSRPELSLKGKTVLVTGGGRGIGLAIVESFAKAQVKTIILTARSETFIQTVSSNLGFDKKYPATQFIGLPLEVTVEESINKLFDSLKDVVDHIDVFVSNAGGVTEYGPKLAPNPTRPLSSGQRSHQLQPTSIHFDVYRDIVYHRRGFPYLGGYLLAKTAAAKMVSLLDVAALAGGLCVYLSHPHADFLSGRVISAHWDVDQIQARKDEIITKNLLKLAISSW